MRNSLNRKLTFIFQELYLLHVCFYLVHVHGYSGVSKVQLRILDMMIFSVDIRRKLKRKSRRR